VSVEVWAIKAAAGEAILRSARGWSLLALDAGWQPTSLRRAEEVLRWAQSGSPVPVGKSYKNLEDAIGEVREACLAVLGESLGFETGRGAASPDAAQGRQDPARSAPNVFLRRALRLPKKGDRASTFAAVIEANCGRLERYFESLGLSAARSLALTAEVFARLLPNEGRWASNNELARLSFGLDTSLFWLARQTYSELSRPALRRRAGRTAVRDTRNLAARERQLTERLAMRIESLQDEALVALAAWTDLGLGHRDIEVVLGLPPDETARLVGNAARALGVTTELLRVHLFASACHRAARAALARRGTG
jgi:hypothetical protein